VVINERFRLQGYFEAFNLFNQLNVNQVVDTFPPDAQGRFHLPPQR
jgi:hypothetical protein